MVGHLAIYFAPSLKRRFLFMAIVNAIFAPFIVLYLLMYSFFRYFEVSSPAFPGPPVRQVILTLSYDLHPICVCRNTTRTRPTLARASTPNSHAGSSASSTNFHTFSDDDAITLTRLRSDISISFPKSASRSSRGELLSPSTHAHPAHGLKADYHGKSLRGILVPSRTVLPSSRFVAFVAGSFAGVLLLASVVDPDLFLHFNITPQRNVLFYIGLFGTILAVARAMVPDDHQIFEPELLLRAVIEHTHYLPDHWKGKLHSAEVSGRAIRLLLHTSSCLPPFDGTDALTCLLLLLVPSTR